MVALSPDATKFAEGEGYTVSILMLTNDTKEAIWETNASNLVSSLAFLNDSTIAIGDVAGTVEIWDLDKNLQIVYVTNCSPDSTMTAIALIEDKDILVCGSGSADKGILMLWDLKSDMPISKFPDHRFSIDDMSWSSSHHILATTSVFTDYVSLWTYADPGHQPVYLANHPGNIKDLEFSPNGQYLPLGSTDNTLIIWDVQENTAAYEFDTVSDGIGAVAWSSDGKLIAASSGETIIVWDMVTGEEIGRFQSYFYPDDLAFSEDGLHLVVLSDNGIFEDWDLDQK